jgi:hypothetical protein
MSAKPAALLARLVLGSCVETPSSEWIAGCTRLADLAVLCPKASLGQPAFGGVWKGLKHVAFMELPTAVD